MAVFEFKLTDHVCAACCGRVLAAKGGGYRCSNCGNTGTKRDDVCTCGIEVNGRNAGIRCVANNNRSHEWPSEIVAEEVPMQESLW